MAYIIKVSGKWLGPCPNKKGEFCINWEVGNTRLRREELEYEKFVEHEFLGNFLNNKRQGRPSKSESGTSEQKKWRGFVGLYLAEDTPVDSSAIEVDTDVLDEEVVSGQRQPLKPFVLEDWIPGKNN